MRSSLDSVSSAVSQPLTRELISEGLTNLGVSGTGNYAFLTLDLKERCVESITVVTT